MLKKILSNVFIFFGLVALFASTNRPVMQYLSDKRNVNTWWGTYQCLHGDLISLSYLDFVEVFSPPYTMPEKIHIDKSVPKNTVLYLQGDSYSWGMADSDFVGVAAYHSLDRNYPAYYHLDTTKRNVLVIEISERLTRDYFKDAHMIDQVRDTTGPKPVSLMMSSHKNYAGMFPLNISVNDFFNPYINQNLQCNLFNYNFIMPMFETKAALNYYIFNRASGDVIISDDRQFLFLRPTATATDPISSYVPIPDADIKTLVDTFNKIYDHYKAEGFNEIYLSIIPNCATIMQNKGYNQFIPRVYNYPGLKMGIVDVYTVFRNSSKVYYWHGDTHWNFDGRNAFFEQVNKQLENNEQAQIRKSVLKPDTHIE